MEANEETGERALVIIEREWWGERAFRVGIEKASPPKKAIFIFFAEKAKKSESRKRSLTIRNSI